MPLSPKLRELLDACRPDSADLAAPEFRDLAEALQHDEQVRQIAERSAAFDRAIHTAQSEIPIPPGLADRILLKLNLPVPTSPQIVDAGSIDAGSIDAGSINAGSIDAGSVNVRRHESGQPSTSVTQCSPQNREALDRSVLDRAVLDRAVLDRAVLDRAVLDRAVLDRALIESEPSVRPAASVSRVTRRGLMWVLSGSVAVALLILVGVWFGLPRQVDPRSADELAEAGARWAEAAQRWTDLNPDHLLIPADHALSTQVRGYFAGWKTFPAEYDRQAIAFGLRGRAGDAWLFAARSSASFLAPDSRPERLPTTGGVSVAAWREGPILYVLVCRERQQRLDDYLIPRKLASLTRPTHVLVVQTPKNPDNGDEA